MAVLTLVSVWNDFHGLLVYHYSAYLEQSSLALGHLSCVAAPTGWYHNRSAPLLCTTHVTLLRFIWRWSKDLPDYPTTPALPLTCQYPAAS